MEELKEIREALERGRKMEHGYMPIPNFDYYDDALAALSRLETRDADFSTADESAKAIAETIDNSMLRLDKEISTAYGRFTPPRVQFDKVVPLIADGISSYAYRYSEDIRKDRDEWKAMAVQYADAVKAKEESK